MNRRELLKGAAAGALVPTAGIADKPKKKEKPKKDTYEIIAYCLNCGKYVTDIRIKKSQPSDVALSPLKCPNCDVYASLRFSEAENRSTSISIITGNCTNRFTGEPEQ